MDIRHSVALLVLLGGIGSLLPAPITAAPHPPGSKAGGGRGSDHRLSGNTAQEVTARGFLELETLGGPASQHLLPDQHLRLT